MCTERNPATQIQIVPSAEVESYTFDKSHNAAEGVLKEGEGAGDRGLRAVAD